MLLKILKHATDPAPAAPKETFGNDRNAPPQTALSAHQDRIGILLGLDLEGVMEVEDSFGLPANDFAGFTGNSYSSRLIQHLREVQTPDSPVGLYLSTHNGGFITKPVLDLVGSVERVAGRGKAIIVVHDANIQGELSVKAYRLSQGLRDAAKSGRFDTASLVENRLTPHNMLESLPLSVTSPGLIQAFLSTLSTPSAPSSSLTSPRVPLPKSFAPLLNPLPTSLPSTLSSTLDAMTLHSHEANNLAFLSRQIAREKSKHEQAVAARAEENDKRSKQGLAELPPVIEPRTNTKEPQRIDLLCLLGSVEGLAKSMGAEAGKGLVRCYL